MDHKKLVKNILKYDFKLLSDFNKQFMYNIAKLNKPSEKQLIKLHTIKDNIIKTNNRIIKDNSFKIDKYL